MLGIDYRIACYRVLRKRDENLMIRDRHLARRALRVTLAVLLVLSVPVLRPSAKGCPFCTAVSNTFSEDIATMDVVIIARLAKPLAPAPLLDEPASDRSLALKGAPQSSIATFTVDSILKGKDLLASNQSFSTSFFGDAKAGDLFLVMGTKTTKAKTINWSAPMRLNARQHDYLTTLVALPKEGPDRLAFFQQYLQDADPMLAQDAYDEFARTPYSAIKQFKSKMDHDQLIKWIEDPKIPASHRRLYLTMLGVCGGEDDLPVLEKRMRATDPQSKSGLDALIACYLALRGPEGVALVEDLFLKRRDDNFSGNYADVYAAIMALRFHGSEGDMIPRKRVLQAFGYLLDYPQMADLIISDLARWEDWSQLDRLVALFKKADSKTTWVRMPIINYVRACPLPEAQKALAEFKEIDPETVKRAMTFFPTRQNDAK